MAKRWNNNPPKPGMVRLGYRWITEEEAKLYIHPKKYDPSFKEICRMYKKRGPYVYIFQIDPMDEPGEDWFIMCSKVKRTSNDVKQSSTLIAKDVGTWIRGIQSMEKYSEVKWSEHYQDEAERQKLFNLL